MMEGICCQAADDSQEGLVFHRCTLFIVYRTFDLKCITEDWPRRPNLILLPLPLLDKSEVVILIS